RRQPLVLRRAQLRLFASVRHDRGDSQFPDRAARGRPALRQASALMIRVAPLDEANRAEWEPLARGYKAFYENPQPPEVYDRVWARLMTGEDIHGLGAWLDGRMVGLAHY